MAKLCAKGKAAAKRKFKVYPSAYANMYGSAVCSGKVTPGGKKKRKKAMGGNVYTAAEMKSKGGRIGRKLGGGTDMGNTAVKKKHKGFSKLPETVQIKINKKLAKKV